MRRIEMIDISDVVYDYIENEINYLEREMQCTAFGKGDVADLYKLQNITTEEINSIAENVLADDEFNDKLNETIHYYLYHV